MDKSRGFTLLLVNALEESQEGLFDARLGKFCRKVYESLVRYRLEAGYGAPSRLEP